MPASPLHRPEAGSASVGRRRRGFTLVEAVVAVGLSGLLFAGVATQLVESTKLSRRITVTLEHSRNARGLIDTLTADIRAAQILRIHPDFADRSTTARDGETGNYLVLHSIDAHGVSTRTVGYYVVALGGSRGWALYRHDSTTGDNVAGQLPGAGSRAQHRVINRAVRLPDATALFRCVRDRGVSIRGEFGTVDTAGSARTEFVRCTISTRS